MVAQLRIDPTIVRHAVHFYAADDELVATVERYLKSGLEGNGVALVIGTASHVSAFEASLAESGIDVARARKERKLVTLDAEETLSRLMVDGRPDADAFDAVVGERVRDIRRTGRRPIAYGEMVAVLWEAGNVTGALQLEELTACWMKKNSHRYAHIQLRSSVSRWTPSAISAAGTLRSWEVS